MSLSGLLDAVRFLTRIPLPSAVASGRGGLGAAAVWFPVAGALVGLTVAAAFVLGSMVTAWVGALAGLVAWVLITGGLHLDGLGDAADGLAASHGTPQRFHEVARDPHAGSFAVIAITMVIAAKLVLLAAVAPAMVWALVLVPAWARWGAVGLGYALPALHDGLGKSFSDGITPDAVWLPALLLGAASIWLASALLLALLIVPLAALYWWLRLGGITGDCLGASIEVTECLLLLALLI